MSNELETPKVNRWARMSLLTGATVWGLIWYPYRALESAGVSGVVSAVLTYLIALIFASVLYFGLLRKTAWCKLDKTLLLGIALASGVCNLGYLLGTLAGEVMRVLLLFYLSPLWTIVLSRLMLGERLSRWGSVVVLLSIAGAITMLWRPGSVLPWPQTFAEWMGLLAGLGFALNNVLSRKAQTIPVEIKSLAVFAGVVLVGLIALIQQIVPIAPAAPLGQIGVLPWLQIFLLGLVLLVVNYVVQYGLTHRPANEAIVLFLFELVVAALSAMLLADERLTLQACLGGSMIVLASLLSTRDGTGAH